MIIYWKDGQAYGASGTRLGAMTLQQAADLAAEQGDKPGDLTFVRIGLPPRS